MNYRLTVVTFLGEEQKYSTSLGLEMREVEGAGGTEEE